MEKSYCECALKKLKKEFSSYNQMMSNEEKLANLFVSCIELDQ